MRKLQQYMILKFESERLKKSNYKIEITLNQARKNNEIVQVAYNQVIKTILRLMDRELEHFQIEELLNKKKKLSNRSGNSKELISIIDKLDHYLYIPELVSIHFSNKHHYKAVIKQGLYINGVKYVRLLAGSGNIRRDTVIFCAGTVYPDLDNILKNDHKDIEIVPSKYSAYYALLNSSALPVSMPKFTVVPDCFIKTNREVDFVVDAGEGEEDWIDTKIVEMECNSFDGQGLISPELNKMWAKELELDYTPANYIIRGPFMKGMVVVFDFKEFAKKYNKRYITDVYGNIVNVNDIELILSESQFKLWKGYDSLESYVASCKKNHLGFGVSRVSPKNDKTFVRSNYQFLQVLSLDKPEIETLCQDTINIFKSLYGNNRDRMLLYSIGANVFEGNFSDWFESLDVISKVLLINAEVSNDKYIRDHFISTLKRKVKDAYLGNLYFEGNYSTLISDPFAQCQHIFGLEVTGLLKENEHYSSFWNKRNVKKVVSARAPLTWKTELVKLNLQDRDDTKEWYKYITSGIVVPAFGIGIDNVMFADKIVCLYGDIQ